MVDWLWELVKHSISQRGCGDRDTPFKDVCMADSAWEEEIVYEDMRVGERN